MKNKQYLFLLLIIFIGACANIKQPTGGPEDKDPPVLEKSIPENNSINFKDQTIILSFDEYVDAQKFRQNGIISPIIEGGYDVQAKKKNVIIKFNEPLKENTTYSINYSDCIKDVTKGNFIKSASLAFSTGPIIDSLSISGEVYDFISEKSIKDIAIELYNSNDTNTIYKHKPVYYSKTNEKGIYTIKNIKEGTYDIYALGDINNNYVYNPNKESVAVIKNFVLTQDTSKINLGLSFPDNKGPERTSLKQEEEYYQLTYSKGIYSYSIKSDTSKIIHQLSKEKNKIQIFNTTINSDTIQLFITVVDSSNNSTEDTVKIKFSEVKNRNKKSTFRINYNKEKLEIKSKDTIRFTLSKPIEKINYELCVLSVDTLKLKTASNNLFLDSNQFTITNYINTSFKDSIVYTFKKGSIINIYEDTLEEIKFKFSLKNPENYGIISGTINCPDSNYIFQLMTEKGEVIDTKINNKEFYYDYLDPIAYRLKIIIDKNKNGRWDAIDLDNNIPPEPIHYYPDILHLRANWEMLNLNFTTKP